MKGETLDPVGPAAAGHSTNWCCRSRPSDGRPMVSPPVHLSLASLRRRVPIVAPNSPQRHHPRRPRQCPSAIAPDNFASRPGPQIARAPFFFPLLPIFNVCFSAAVYKRGRRRRASKREGFPCCGRILGPLPAEQVTVEESREAYNHKQSHTQNFKRPRGIQLQESLIQMGVLIRFKCCISWMKMSSLVSRKHGKERRGNTYLDGTRMFTRLVIVVKQGCKSEFFPGIFFVFVLQVHRFKKFSASDILALV